MQINVRNGYVAQLVRSAATNPVAWALMATSATITPSAAVAAAQQQDEQARVESPTDDIVVTARKRSEKLQDVPISMTAISEKSLERNYVTRLPDLEKLSPNVVLRPTPLIATTLEPFIRGIGQRTQEPSLDPGVAVSIDGVYLASFVGSAIDLFDVGQVEILRGPQGILQGRNSPGGAINITTRRPGNEMAARMEASYGKFNTYSLKAVVEGPLVPDILKVKAAVTYNKSDGYIKNLNRNLDTDSGRETLGARFGVLYTPADNLSLYVTADYLRDRSFSAATRNISGLTLGFADSPPSILCVPGEQGGFLGFGECVVDKPWTTRKAAMPRNHLDEWGITSNFNWDISDGISLTSVTGYRHFKEILEVDADGTPLDLLRYQDRTNHTSQFSQEIRLSSNRQAIPHGGSIDWLLGVYYLNYKFSLHEPILFLGFDTGSPDRSQVLNSYAAFGSVTYHLTDPWSITGGFRRTSDRKVGHVSFPALPQLPVGTFRGNFSNTSFDASTDYKISPDVLAYLRFSQGYRSGGINLNQPVPDGVVNYRPEKVDSFEAGLKTQLFDHRLTANLAAFHNKYKDILSSVEIQIAEPPFFLNVNQNKGSATINGVELELVARPVDELTISSSFGYLDATFDDTHARLPMSAKYTFTAGADYTIKAGEAGFVVLSADYRYRGAANVNPSNFMIGMQKPVGLFNGSITYRTADERFEISAYGQNLTNRVNVETIENAPGLIALASDGAPRTFGVRFLGKF